MSYVLQPGFAYALAAPGGSKRRAAEARHLGLRRRLMYFKKLFVHFQELVFISTKQWAFQPL